ncbi:hypothetical protein DLR72_12210 [Vibrio paracholerae]|uniref:DUF3265 domain-containing protein n=1 Tax=Vibrio paracholerae TaxID=650003 RepID=A0ABD7FTV0_9VIBR|nr:hypothetical protein DLR72_12210 [Vibrio paracholerae]
MCLERFICAHGDKFCCCPAAIQVAWVCHFKTLINRAGKTFCNGHKKTTMRWVGSYHCLANGVTH